MVQIARGNWILTVLLFAALVHVLPLHADTVYETNQDFVKRAFGNPSPRPATVWLSGARKLAISDLLGHDYPALRIRYWCRAPRSAWVLEEIGKDLPITVGIIVEEHQIQSVKVMVYRENRGGEVVVPAFVDQFTGLRSGRQQGLSGPVDGISGATLSVRALTRLAAMALFLHLDTGCNDQA